MKDCTEIVFVLDESGSMDIIRQDVIGGFNSFVADQKALPGEAYLTLVTFNSYGKMRNVFEHLPIGDVRDLNNETYTPQGMTALLQAVSITIDGVGKRLEALPEAERPEKVIMVIMTDGEENNSGSEYTKELINEKIKHQSEVYKWQFLFPGANQDAFAVGCSIGIHTYNTVTYDATPKGTGAMYSAVSRSVSSYRTMGETEDLTGAYNKAMAENIDVTIK